MAILAIANPNFQPAMRIITAITNGFPTAITTSFAHNYIDGIIVRIIIPRKFGMYQINEMTGSIIVTSPITFNVAIDSTNFDPFVIPVKWPFDQQYAQVIPIGEDNALLSAATQNVL